MYYVSCADFAEEQSQRKEYTLTLLLSRAGSWYLTPHKAYFMEVVTSNLQNHTEKGQPGSHTARCECTGSFSELLGPHPAHLSSMESSLLYGEFLIVISMRWSLSSLLKGIPLGIPVIRLRSKERVLFLTDKPIFNKTKTLPTTRNQFSYTLFHMTNVIKSKKTFIQIP